MATANPAIGMQVRFRDPQKRKWVEGTVLDYRRSSKHPWKVYVVMLGDGREVEVHEDRLAGATAKANPEALFPRGQFVPGKVRVTKDGLIQVLLDQKRRNPVGGSYEHGSLLKDVYWVLNDLVGIEISKSSTLGMQQKAQKARLALYRTAQKLDDRRTEEALADARKVVKELKIAQSKRRNPGGTFRGLTFKQPKFATREAAYRHWLNRIFIPLETNVRLGDKVSKQELSWADFDTWLKDWEVQIGKQKRRPKANPAPEIVLRALDNNGKTFYYTGRAGAGWVSKSVKDAFGYGSMEGARRKAAMFNKMEKAHGLWFVAVPRT